jgi:hypothetical protein
MAAPMAGASASRLRGAYAIWDLRYHFRQSRQAPYRSVEPVRRAINCANPLAGKRHHLGFELIAATAMQHSALLVEQADRFGAHRLATRG